jgi:peroxiredoxin
MAGSTLLDLLEEAFRRCRDMDASLGERLEAFVKAVREISPEFAEAVDRLVAHLSQTRVGEDAPDVGEAMPSFLLPDDAGRLTSLDDLLANGPTAVTFHRGHWCPYCRLNTHALAGLHAKGARDGYQIAAIMPDRQQFVRKFKDEAKASFPILTDIDNGYALSLNLVFWVGDRMTKFIAASGLDVPTYQGNAAWMLPIPATFVVGGDRRIKARFVDPDYRRRVSIEELREALHAAQLSSGR